VIVHICAYPHSRDLRLCGDVMKRKQDPPYSTSRQVATLPVRLIFAIVSACGLHFRPFGPQLGLRPRYTALKRSGVTAASYNNADDASPWWRRLYDVTDNRTPNSNIPIL